MTLVKTTITKIEVPRTDFKTKKIETKIHTDSHSPFEKKFILTNSEEATKEIVRGVKRHIKANSIPEGDSVFSQEIGVYIKNSDENIKRINHFMSKLIEKINKLNMSTDAYDYMKLFNEVNDIHILNL